MQGTKQSSIPLGWTEYVENYFNKDISLGAEIKLETTGHKIRQAVSEPIC